MGTSGIFIILYSLIPGLLYLLLAYLTTPYNSWNLKKALLYLIGGSLASPVIAGFYYIYPQWSTFFTKFSTEIFFQLLIYTFIQIALFEETVKYFLFLVFRKMIIPFNINHHPLSIMIYGGAVSLGFAFTENVFYAMKYTPDVLIMRNITSVILHMICGMMMGYFISLAKFNFKIKTNPTNSFRGRSLFDMIMFKNPKFRKYFYTFLGVAVATFLHGLYDYNLISVTDFGGTTPDYHITFTVQTILLAVGFYWIKKMMDHLIKIHVNNKNNS